jgi:hypothetical protein
MLKKHKYAEIARQLDDGAKNKETKRNSDGLAVMRYDEKLIHSN